MYKFCIRHVLSGECAVRAASANCCIRPWREPHPAVRLLLGGFCAVEIPHVDAAVMRARVDIASVGRSGRGEVAADQSLEDTMAAECDQRTVVPMRFVTFGIVR